MIELVLASHFSFMLDSTEDCNNAGPCCFSCPAFDQCEQHYDEDADPA